MLFSDYFWEDGRPKGFRAAELTGYKIASDPYKKRIVVERYENGRFMEMTYDSLMFDFRKIDPRHQRAWEKETLIEEENRILLLVRNDNDQVVCLEENLYESGILKKCRILSAMGGLFLAENQLYYRSLGDPYSGVVLSDRTGRPVIMKQYEEEEGEFSQLILEKKKFLPEDAKRKDHPAKNFDYNAMVPAS